MKFSIKSKSLLYKLLTFTIFTGLAFSFFAAYVLFVPNIKLVGKEKNYLYIRDNNAYSDVRVSLKSHLKSGFTFHLTAKLLNYDKKIRTGRYELTGSMNNFTLVRKLRSGSQTPVRLTFNNIRTKEQLAKRLSVQLMADSVSIVNLLNDSLFLSQYGFNKFNSVAVFIPNTYEIFWDSDANEIFDRMLKEYNKFWNTERKTKAALIPLTLTEVSTLASIIEEESNLNNERPIIAGLYINRLKINMPLQADPTVKFAFGDFTLRRVIGEPLQVKSPYNTYKNKGLPPGPIRITTPTAIDAVLNFKNHDYIFMCAKETLNGEHNFAVTWNEHERNAKKYQQALNERKIFK